jgi:hypothetical protein
MRRLKQMNKEAFLALALAAVFFCGCHRTAAPSSMSIQCEFTPQPPQAGPVILALKLSSSDAQPVTGAEITLEGDMSHPGMAPVFGEATEIGLGRYQGHLDFSMAGDWVILAHIKLANGRRLEHQMNLRAIRPN